MSQLKALRSRIVSVRSTRKITSAMKMVAAARLKKAQNQAITARPHARATAETACVLALEQRASGQKHALVDGTPDGCHVLICPTASRGLCGSFSSNLIKKAKQEIAQQHDAMWVLCVGQKGYQSLKNYLRQMHLSHVGIEVIETPSQDASVIAAAIEKRLRDIMAQKTVASVKIIYAEFRSAIAQIVRMKSLVPLAESTDAQKFLPQRDGVHSYEPQDDADALFDDFAFYVIRNQCYHALLENIASEHGARMTAMDNATRNASDMIDRLTLDYNRKRQAMITRELIEIISGAEAL